MSTLLASELFNHYFKYNGNLVITYIFFVDFFLVPTSKDVKCYLPSNFRLQNVIFKNCIAK